MKEELVPAFGCTEPIAIAYCAAEARTVLGVLPEKVEILASGNIIKNVKSVIVPNTDGLKGIPAAAAAGIIAFSKFLHWLLQHYHRETLLVMAGFIIGSLVKVWPWSNMETVILSQFPELAETDAALGEAVIAQYSGMVDMHIGGAVAWALAGFFLVVGIEVASILISRRREQMS